MELTTEKILTYDCSKIQSFIIDEVPFILELLKDRQMKEKLIKNSTEEDFTSLVRKLPTMAAFYLFDDVGIEILENSQNSFDKLYSIMLYGKDYISILLENSLFCELIIKHIYKLSDLLHTLNCDSAEKLIKYVHTSQPSYLTTVFTKLSIGVQKQIVEKISFPIDVMHRLVVQSGSVITEHLLKNDMCTPSLNDYSFHELLLIFSKDCPIPSQFYLESTLKQKITTMESIKDYRFLVNALATNNDVSQIEQARKKYYEKEFNSFNVDMKMLDRYYQCYLEVSALIDMPDVDMEKLDEIIYKYFNFFGSGANESQFKSRIYYLYQAGNKNNLRLFFSEESRLQISNMIIDYHFEDIPHNFFLDIRQLCRFQNSEGRTLCDSDFYTYQMLLYLDNSSYEEQMYLHERLSQENFIAKHYDVFREAKDKAASLMLDAILNKDSIMQYLNKDLSLEHNVPIYVLDGQEFFAFVKATDRPKYRALNYSDMVSTVDGASYSLDGSGKLETYRDPRIYFNLIFSDFPISQVVHMYPVDSYSKYERGYSSATTRVYEFHTPTEFVEKSKNYNEIVLAQPNMLNRSDDLNQQLKVPTLMGIYCYDEITEYDIASAKNLGVGIVLVKTKAYNIDKHGRMSTNDTISGSLSRNYIDGIDYFDNVNADDMVTRRVKMYIY